jgi:hypothetical protein
LGEHVSWRIDEGWNHMDSLYFIECDPEIKSTVERLVQLLDVGTRTGLPRAAWPRSTRISNDEHQKEYATNEVWKTVTEKH